MSALAVDTRGGAFSRGAFAGLLAGLAMSLVMLAMRLTLDAPSIPELIADRFTAFVPPAVFNFLLDALLTWAKPLLFLGLFALQLALSAALGAAFALLLEHQRAVGSWPWLAAVGLTLLLTLFNGLALSPATRGGIFGAALPSGAWRFTLATILYYAVYAAALAYLLQPVRQAAAAADVDTVSRGRRAFLRRSLFIAAGVAAVAWGAKTVVEGFARATPSRIFSTPGEMSPEVTPNDRFYVVSKNIIDPRVDAAGWKLEVRGLVESPFTLTLDELKAMPSTAEYVTLECISNYVGGDLMSNAQWRGVPLRDLLARAKVKPEAADVACFSVDGYSDSLPLERALHPEVRVVYEMNGQPLPNEHGAPARLLAPGKFGLKSVKWLTRIEPRPSYRGYWQERGWSEDAEVKTTSRIDVPRDGAELGAGEITLGGVAFAGARSISRVEISADSGKTWQSAYLKLPPLSTYTWVLWTAPLRFDATGGRTLQVRATDGTGKLQEAEVADSLPDGATGYHIITINVRRPEGT